MELPTQLEDATVAATDACNACSSHPRLWIFRVTPMALRFESADSCHAHLNRTGFCLTNI